MNLWECPKCGRQSQQDHNTQAVFCRCGEKMDKINDDGTVYVESPTLIFRGDW